MLVKLYVDSQYDDWFTRLTWNLLGLGAWSHKGGLFAQYSGYKEFKF